jgi:hypothetical protein
MSGVIAIRFSFSRGLLLAPLFVLAVEESQPCPRPGEKLGLADPGKTRTVRDVLHSVVLSVTAYVIIDLQYPRLGFIQMTDSDQVLADLRRSMN